MPTKAGSQGGQTRAVALDPAFAGVTTGGGKIMRWTPCPAENSGRRRRGAVVGGRAVGEGGDRLGAAPDHAGDLARLAGAAEEALQGEHAAAEAIGEAGGNRGELEGSGG